MLDDILKPLGFGPKESKAYRLLMLRGGLRPAQLQKLTGESRVNCYAILDRLVEAGIARRSDENKKLVYLPEDPSNIEVFLTKRITEEQARLRQVRNKMPYLQSIFTSHGGRPIIKTYSGKAELRTMYDDQVSEKSDELYFVRSTQDIHYFGIEDLEKIRMLAAAKNKRRIGITPVVTYSPTDPRADAKSKLKRTWLPKGAYDQKVEWAVTGEVLQALSFVGDGYGVSIRNAEIARSFQKLVELLAEYIKKDPDYEKIRLYKESDPSLLSAETKSALRHSIKVGDILSRYLIKPIPSITRAVELKKSDGSYRTHAIVVDGRNDEQLVKASDFGLKGSSYYSRPNRLTGDPLLGVSSDVYIRKSVAEKLQKINEFLMSDPGVLKKYGQPLELYIDEGFRDVRVQNYVYDHAFAVYYKKHKPDALDEEIEEARNRTLARGTEPGKDVDPLSPPPHYTGAAVDVNIQKIDGTKLVFGLTAIVTLGKQAFTDYYEQLKESYSVKDDNEARENRRLLYWLMTEQGFENNPEEWWHYSIGDQMWARMGGHGAAYYSIPPNIPDFAP